MPLTTDPQMLGYIFFQIPVSRVAGWLDAEHGSAERWLATLAALAVAGEKSEGIPKRLREPVADDLGIVLVWDGAWDVRGRFVPLPPAFVAPVLRLAECDAESTGPVVIGASILYRFSENEIEFRLREVPHHASSVSTSTPSLAP